MSHLYFPRQARLCIWRRDGLPPPATPPRKLSKSFRQSLITRTTDFGTGTFEIRVILPTRFCKSRRAGGMTRLNMTSLVNAPVLVLGGGISGLAAARVLQDNGRDFQ